MPEAKLAREAELCYATVAMVTDWDCWKTDEQHVTVDQIIKTMTRNVGIAREMIRLAVPRLREGPSTCPAGCDRALQGAIMTAAGVRDPSMVARLAVVAGESSD